MASEALRSLEACHETRRRLAIRPGPHDRFDQGVVRLEEQVKGSQPTLAELPQAVLALRQEWTHAVTEGWMAQTQRPVLEQRTVACRPCGRMLSARGPGECTVETRVGAIRLRRPDADCQPCQLGRALLDAVLGLTNRRRPPNVHKAVVKLPQEMP